LINRHNVVLPSPLSFLAVPTVTLRGFATGDSWSERPVLDMLTMLLRVRLQINAEYGDETSRVPAKVPDLRVPIPDFPLVRKLEI